MSCTMVAGWDYALILALYMTNMLGVPCGIVNRYLSTDDTGTCNPGAANQIMSAHNGMSVRLLLLTHGHTDRCNSAVELSERSGVSARIIDLPGHTKRSVGVPQSD